MEYVHLNRDQFESVLSEFSKMNENLKLLYSAQIAISDNLEKISNSLTDLSDTAYLIQQSQKPTAADDTP